MNILITGINGFLGRELTKRFLAEHDGEIHITGISHSTATVEGATVRKADVLDIQSLENVFSEQSFDVVFHFAAITEHDRIVHHAYDTLRTNNAGTENLLQCFNKYCKNSLFIYASSGKVYGRTDEMPITENARTDPTTILGKSKYITERLIDYYAIPENKFLFARIFNVYGETQKSTFVVPTILNQLKQGDELSLGNLFDKRDYLYSDDLCEALFQCMMHKDNWSGVDVVNIGSGIPVSVEMILDELESILCRTFKVTQNAARMRKDETSVEYCSNKKLCDVCDWKMRYSLHTALEKMCGAFGLLSDKATK